MTALFTAQLPERGAQEITPGAIHVPNWLAPEQQQWLADRFHERVRGPVPLRAATVRGHHMSVRTVCLGWHWQPYKYTRDAADVNGARVLPFPDWMIRLGRRALQATGPDMATIDSYTPDTALVNHYDTSARLGMHQDKDEESRAPVVSLSIGDTCTFRFGNTESRAKPYTDLLLASGDLFVFGGPARLAYHGVPRVHQDTAPQGAASAAAGSTSRCA
ncbi:alpha-ketoglutarate-dependent dioxygenase AlkB family protein [Streptomyces sp. NPDC057592]|uniref:alpha-ketoglutarate-dependent dioxygenase AlkB family protein n=1 Tax=unclassified Streptomyces TaxID=2593676 RepID=UPI0036801F48